MSRATERLLPLLRLGPRCEGHLHLPRGFIAFLTAFDLEGPIECPSCAETAPFRGIEILRDGESFGIWTPRGRWRFEYTALTEDDEEVGFNWGLDSWKWVVMEAWWWAEVRLKFRLKFGKLPREGGGRN